MHITNWTILQAGLSFAHQALPAAAAHAVSMPQLPPLPPPIHTLFERRSLSRTSRNGRGKKKFDTYRRSHQWQNRQCGNQINPTLAPTWSRNRMVARNPYMECGICPFTLPKWTGQKRDLRRFTLCVIVLSGDKNLVYVLVRSAAAAPSRQSPSLSVRHGTVAPAYLSDGCT